VTTVREALRRHEGSGEPDDRDIAAIRAEGLA
jgi:hypothetical protein